MSEDNQETTDPLDRLDVDLKRAELIERTKNLTAPQREEFFYNDPSYPPDLLRDIAEANGDTNASIAMGLRQMDAATEPGENIMDAVAGTRTDEDGNEEEVTYADLQREANEEGNINESIRLGLEAHDAAQAREYEDALNSPEMAEMRELAEQRGREFLEKFPHLDPNRQEEQYEPPEEPDDPRMSLREGPDTMGEYQWALSKQKEAQQRGDIEGSIKWGARATEAMPHDGPEAA